MEKTLDNQRDELDRQMINSRVSDDNHVELLMKHSRLGGRHQERGRVLNIIYRNQDLCQCGILDIIKKLIREVK